MNKVKTEEKLVREFLKIEAAIPTQFCVRSHDVRDEDAMHAIWAFAVKGVKQADDMMASSVALAFVNVKWWRAAASSECGGGLATVNLSAT
jgi:hypothetical protein